MPRELAHFSTRGWAVTGEVDRKGYLENLFLYRFQGGQFVTADANLLPSIFRTRRQAREAVRGSGQSGLRVVKFELQFYEDRS